ncbi:hypothetical protein ACQ86N_19875 [Puia sp. P3]|uniref:hypothetical protein n=1 Tax=Puia sp. P3 TaxID=3423952 RepID=UPI003D66F309
MGLKAYDLVWIEGKSAAWRYPCEIEELSAFAPAVEEQPFDRFYKKTSSPVKGNANSSAVASEPAKLIAEPATTPSTSVFSGEPSTVPGKRIIYVTMPAAKTPVNPAAARETSSPIPARETRETPGPAVIRETATPARETIEPSPFTAPPVMPTYVDDRSFRPEPAPTPVPATNPVYFAENNYAQPSHEDISIEEFLPRLQKRRSGRLAKPLVVALTVLAVLAAGIFIGLSINRDTLGFRQKIASNAHSANAQPIHTAQQPPAPVVQHETSPAVIDPQPATAAITTEQTKTDKPLAAEVKPTVAAEKPSATPIVRTARTKEKAIRPAIATAAAAKDSSASPVIPHREAARRTDADDRADNADQAANTRAAIASQVSASANGYTVGTFGGINGLQVTVSNRSAYPLDLVVVEIQYIQANKKIYKTENLYFRGIGAGSALMQEAPKSSRGIRVQYKITTISSKDLGLSYSGI